MARPRKTPAFVLRRVNYGDQDLVVTLLGRKTGAFSAIAKAARASKKRFGGGLQPMRCLEASYTQKPNASLAFLREIDVVEDFPAIERDFERITMGSYATELVREITQEGQTDPQTFDLLRATYRQLSTADDSVLALEAVLHNFELSLLELHGALPALTGCFRCGKPGEDLTKLRCMRTGQGLVCGDCRRPGENIGVIRRPTLAVLRYFHRPGPRAPAGLSQPATLHQVRRVIDASFEHLLDQPLKSRLMLDTVLDEAFPPS